MTFDGVLTQKEKQKKILFTIVNKNLAKRWRHCRIPQKNCTEMFSFHFEYIKLKIKD